MKRCSVTGIQMDEGYEYRNGEMYFMYMAHLLIQLRNDGYEGDDYEIADQAHDDKVYKWGWFGEE